MFSLRRVKLSLLAPSPSEASRMAFSRAGARVPTSVSSGKNLIEMGTGDGRRREFLVTRHVITRASL